MPPVREASTNPSAATVLPAPVACSNQKRRPAFGSSGCSSSWTSASSSAPGSCQSWGSSSSSSSASSSLSSSSSSSPGIAAEASCRDATWAGALPLPLPAPLPAVAVALLLGEQRGQRPGEGVDLVGGEDGALGEMRLVFGQQPLEPEQQREVSAPLDRRLLVAGLDLYERGVERATARRARSKGFIEGLALVDELLTCEQLRSRDGGSIGKRGDSTHQIRELRRVRNASRRGTKARLRRPRKDN